MHVAVMTPPIFCCNRSVEPPDWRASRRKKEKKKRESSDAKLHGQGCLHATLIGWRRPTAPLCVCLWVSVSVCVVHPGAVSLQHSLIHSIFLVGGASVSKEEERWPQANDWHILLLSNWPSASLWGGPTADLTSAEEADYIHVCTHARTQWLGIYFRLVTGVGREVDEVQRAWRCDAAAADVDRSLNSNTTSGCCCFSEHFPTSATITFIASFLV